MGLRDFLSQHSGATTENPLSVEIAAWQAAVGALVERFRAQLSSYEKLQLLPWNVLREHRGVRYNAQALTIEFGEAVITLEPVAIKPEAGLLGRASLNCGVRQIYCDCNGDAQLWRYRWVIPHDPADAELTGQAIELLVEELLKSSAG